MHRVENIRALNKLTAPVHKIEARDRGKISVAKSDVFGYLEKDLYVCGDARVVVNKNINVQMGIYNAAQGVIHDIVYENEEAKYLIIDLDTSNLSKEQSFENV